MTVGSSPSLVTSSNVNHFYRFVKSATPWSFTNSVLTYSSAHSTPKMCEKSLALKKLTVRWRGPGNRRLVQGPLGPERTSKHLRVEHQEGFWDEGRCGTVQALLICPTIIDTVINVFVNSSLCSKIVSIV